MMKLKEEEQDQRVYYVTIRNKGGNARLGTGVVYVKFPYVVPEKKAMKLEATILSWESLVLSYGIGQITWLHENIYKFKFIFKLWN